MTSKAKLKELVANNKTGEAIQQLLQITDGTWLNNDAITLSARHQQYERDKRLNIQSDRDLEIARNRINTALLQIINHLPVQVSPGTAQEPRARPGKQRLLWKYIAGAALIIGLLGSLAEGLNYINLVPERATTTDGNTVTILVHGEGGKDQLVLPNRGIVKLVYGDAIIPEQINNKGEATFKQVPAQFFQSGASVEILFQDPEGEPFRAVNPDSLYRLQRGQYIGLIVQLLGMDEINGIVKDIETGWFLENVTVRLLGRDTFTNEYGEFVLRIPSDQRRQFVTIRAFKEGYQDFELSNVPTTTDKEIPILMKPQK